MRSPQLELRSLLRSSPRIVLVASLLVFLITSQWVALRFAGYFIVTEVLSSILKTIVGKTMSTVSGIHRPIGGGQCMGCSALFRCEAGCIDVSNQIGMPSGHSLGMAMAATFWSLWIWNSSGSTKRSKIMRCTILCLLALAVIISRTSLVENCHTVPQVTVGTILGVGLGVGFYFLEQKILSTNKK